MKTLLSFSLALAFSLGSALAQAAAGTPADEADIRALVDQLPAAWSKTDPKMVASLFLVDVDYVSSTGRVAGNRTEVERAFAQQWAGVYRGTKLATSVRAVRFLKPDVAVVDGDFHITGMKGPDGKTLPVRDGMYASVAMKKKDRWYIAALRGMVPNVPQGAPGR
ncbi:MAG: SgcJ/EcaC family oxidoreductase [Thermoanaerobaculia bacterium]